jgi:hypothetical protein
MAVIRCWLLTVVGLGLLLGLVACGSTGSLASGGGAPTTSRLDG